MLGSSRVRTPLVSWVWLTRDPSFYKPRSAPTAKQSNWNGARTMLMSRPTSQGVHSIQCKPTGIDSVRPGTFVHVFCKVQKAKRMHLCQLPHSVLLEEKLDISARAPHSTTVCSYSYDGGILIFLLLQRWYCRSPGMPRRHS